MHQHFFIRGPVFIFERGGKVFGIKNVAADDFTMLAQSVCDDSIELKLRGTIFSSVKMIQHPTW